MTPELMHLTASRGAPVATADGLPRSRAEEERLNELARHCLATPQGREFIAYLRSITIEVALLPSATDAELRHMEGMRALVAIIHARANSTPNGD